MTILSPRRFPDTIRRKVSPPGRRNDFGEYEEEPVYETDLPASIQPAGLEDSESLGGGVSRLTDRLVVYLPGYIDLRAARDGASGDVVEVDGHDYEVVDSMTWRRHHTKAILLRQP